MALDEWLWENGDSVLLEDSSGNLLLEQGKTPWYACGFECGFTPGGGANVAGGGISDHWESPPSGAGTFSIDTGTVRTGARSAKLVTVANEVGWNKPLTGRGPVAVGSVAFRFEAWTTVAGNALLVRTAHATAPIADVELDQTSKKVGILIAGAAKVEAPTAWVLNQWYVIDYFFDYSGTTYSCGFTVTPDGGSAEVVVGPTLAGQTPILEFTNVRFGLTNGTNSTMTVYLDDIVLSSNKVDYPLGPCTVPAYVPNADGTHSFTLGDFKDSNVTNIAVAATTVNALLAKRPMTGTASFVSQNVIRSTGYVEVGFEDPVPTHDALGVEVVMALRAAGLLADTFGAKINDGGTLADVATLIDVSQTTQCQVSRHFANAPGYGSNWPLANLQGLLARLGYSTDVTDIPFADAITLEVAYGPPPPPASAFAPRNYHHLQAVEAYPAIRGRY